MAKVGPKEALLRSQRESAPKQQTTRTKKLTDKERSRLAELCATVQKGLETFTEVGTALQEIRESGLYLEECSTFEAFVQLRFGVSRGHAYRQIAAAETVRQLQASVSNGDIGPSSEAQVRPLTRLPKEKRPEAWQEAVRGANGKQPTARQVERAVERRKPAKAEPAVEKRPEPKDDHDDPREPEEPVDVIGEWERAEKECERLRAVIAAVESGNELAHKFNVLSEKYARLEGRLGQEMTTRGEAEKTAKYAQGLLKKVRAALSVSGDKEILPAIADLRR